ncbi:MAG: malto-oligosyltrehalose trehalohydrolase [Acidobacteriota bacterium]
MGEEVGFEDGLPVGASLVRGGGVRFRVWAPKRKSVLVVIEGGPGGPAVHTLEPEGNGYFSATVVDAGEGSLYRYRLDDDEPPYPDPASRFQPEGPEGPSQVIDPSKFRWSDRNWRGVSIEGQVIYEMHIGTFTREGTYEAAGRHLSDLAEMGITLLEVMPVADFAGNFGWGYDGVDLYAPTRLYGPPDHFRRFVDLAHSLGMGVILDVVYNHLGPVGNHLKQYSDDYFSKRYITEWGEAFNFDGENSGPVREFIVDNACYWIREFHIDGLRLDATQSIFDSSPEHVLALLTRRARDAAGKRSIVLIAENEPQNATLVQPLDQGGFGMDGVVNDDFHHTVMVAMTGRNEAYYMDYLGTPQELLSTARWGYLYQGQWYKWQKKRRGTQSFGLKPATFVNFLQNHDQIANSPRGERCTTQTSPGRARAMTAFLFLTPGTPLLFMGQEFCSSKPFSYFADHAGELGHMVRRGRAEFIMQFQSLRSPDIQKEFPDPADPETFERCRLDHSERETHAHSYLFHRDLIRLRREDHVFRSQRSDWMHGAVLGQEAFVLRYFGGEDGDRLVLINLGRDLEMSPSPEPLLAPPAHCRWDLLWTSEAARYGGNGTPPLDLSGIWTLPGHTAIVLTSREDIHEEE